MSARIPRPAPQIRKAIEARGLKQAEAVKPLGVTQPRVSDLVQGRLDLFSADSLIDMPSKLGLRIRLAVFPPKKRLRVASGRRRARLPAESPAHHSLG